MSNYIIEFENVYKEYELGRSKVLALKGVNLKIEEGEFVTIVGPSGSGKSTFLHLAGLLDRPTKGKVLFKGKDTKNMDDNLLADLRKKYIGFVFQEFYLIPNLSALENVELPMIFSGVPKEERRKRAMRLLELVGLKHRAYHSPSELSGGERQRVAIARALSNDPEIILADEPTGSLDIKTGRKIVELFKELNKSGKTIILVTHDLRILDYAERIIVIKDGRVVGENISIDEAIALLRR